MKKVSISFNLLLSIYIIVPILIGVVLVDIFLLDRAIKPLFSSALLSAFFFLLLFEGPHLWASFLSYFDREYISFYKKKLLFRLPLVLLAGCILVYFNRELSVVAIVFYTIYHIISQQAGILKIMTKSKPRFYDTWRISSTISVFIIYAFSLNVWPTNIYGIYIWGVSTFIFLVTSLYINFHIKNEIGKRYFIAIILSLITSASFFFLGYIFLSLFVLRFVHDITAFVFYITHDTNRNLNSAKNFIYKIFSPLKIPLILLIPIIGIAITYILTFQIEIHNKIVYAAVLITFTHYYLESFMWKNDSIHRSYVSFIN